MILDHRTYTCRPGTLNRHLDLYAEHGWPVQRRHLGEPLVFAVTETGDVNSFVHVWRFEDAADRAARRAAMKRDPDWIAYLRKSAEAGCLVRQVNCLLTPADFFPGR